jgi:hypothetical protein
VPARKAGILVSVVTGTRENYPQIGTDEDIFDKPSRKTAKAS